MDEKDAARYAGRPLLILLENYALAAIGELPADREATVSAAVERLLGGQTSEWRVTVRTASGLPPDFDARLRELWRNQTAGISPIDFVMAVSEANFLPLIDPA